MKRPPSSSVPPPPAVPGPRYWRSLDELADTPGFRAALAREFPEGAASIEGVDRRQFMKLMAASFALGGLGLSGCRRPEANILPFGKSAEFTIPGLPLYYTTALPLRRTALPLLAETHQGRPTKLEGNPSYTPHGGASTLLAQASVLDLYDPDRAREHTRDGRPLAAADVSALLAHLHQTHAGNGQGLAFLADTSSSPTRARLLARLRQVFPHALWAEYEPVQDEPPVEAAVASFGRAVRPIYRFARAKRILALDADFLHAEAGSLQYTREFSQGRRVAGPQDGMNRLYVVESGFTLTGSMADHRLRLPSSHILPFAATLANLLLNTDHFTPLTEGLAFRTPWLEQCARDLAEHPGECLVVAGAHQPVAVHVLVHALNAKLRNLGQTVEFLAEERAPAAPLSALADALRAGAVQTLVILHGNPVYNAPADLDFPALLKAVPQVIRYGTHVDETAAAAGTFLAAAHYLESWGDARTLDGTIVPIQPMIQPLFGGLMEVELLARLAGEANPDPHAQVAATLATYTDGSPQAFARFLHEGLLAGSAHPVVPVTFNLLRASRLLHEHLPVPFTPDADRVEVRFAVDHKMDDGRFANNGWLQEVPDPITKLAWDNVILVSPRLAKKLGITPQGSNPQVSRIELAEVHHYKEQAFLGELMVGGRTLRGPMHIQPGLADYTVVLPLGYGRTRAGHVGTGAGFNAYAVRPGAASHFAPGTLRNTGLRQTVATTQEHWSMEGRDIVREANLDEFRVTPGFVKEATIDAHAPANYGKDEGLPLAAKATQIPRGNSLYQTPSFDGLHQWGMSIDLNTCTGCNACVVACQAENNIPIVGREQVKRGREMHWIRLDRYYTDGRIDTEAFGAEGNREIPEDPQTVVQPMTCQHCELAPCETVCPVNATVHDEEGLNVMAYNRCIGTRYCANNCPYKVRRFNFFDFNKRALDALYQGPFGHQDEMPELLKMAKNPDVTVRMRGVMEKCTFCVQRIQQAKIAQLRAAGATGEVLVPDGAVRTACQQVCPAEAIVFGNLKDPASAVARAKAQDRDYAVLGYLNIRPRTTYLGKLRNSNPHMPDHQPLPFSRVEYQRKNHPAHPAPGTAAEPPATHGGKH